MKLISGQGEVAMNSYGVIYVASRKHRFLCEAIASAESLKEKVSDISITLFTDMEDLYKLTIKPFDNIIPIPSDQAVCLIVNSSWGHGLFANVMGLIGSYNIQSWGRGIHAKVKSRIDPFLVRSWGRGIHAKVMSFIHSPYQRTVFLDSDTRILSSEFVRVFDFLEDHSIAMVPCTKYNSGTCRLYGPMFNSGVIAYRKDAQVNTLFREWQKLNQAHFELAILEPPGSTPYLSRFNPAERRILLCASQTSLAQLLSPIFNKYDIAVKALDETWNARNYPRDRLDRVIIDHADCHKIKPNQVKGFLKSRGIRVSSKAILRTFCE
jgi:hypothetical protein